MGYVQDGLAWILTPFLWASKKVNQRMKMILISLLFATYVLSLCFIGYRVVKVPYITSVWKGLLLLFLILFCSLDEKLKRIQVRWTIVVPWYLMCGVFIVSDIVVPKSVNGLGIILAIAFPMLFYVWQNHSHPEMLFRALINGLKLVFILIIVVQFGFRIHFDNSRYSGFFTNPNVLGMVMSSFLCLFLSEIQGGVKKRKPWYYAILNGVAVGICLRLLTMTQSRTAYMMSGAVILIFCITWLVWLVKKKEWACSGKWLLVVILTAGLMYPATYWGVGNIPKFIGHTIEYQGETLFFENGETIEKISEAVDYWTKRGIPVNEVTKYEPTMVQKAQAKAAAEAAKKAEQQKNSKKNKTTSEKDKASKDNSNESKNQSDLSLNTARGDNGESTSTLSRLNQLSSNRLTIYVNYYKSLNIRGHKYIGKSIQGTTFVHAHNTWLQYGYSYGWFGLLFYGLLTLLGFVYAIRFCVTHFQEESGRGFFVLGIITLYLVGSVTECFILPFGMFTSFLFWLVFGYLFEKEHR